MSNLNVNNTATASSTATAIFKPTNDPQKTTNGFQSTLEKEIHAGAFSDLTIKTEDGKIIELKDCQRIHIEPATAESIQKMLDLSRAKAEEAMTPEGQKKYLMSKEVEAVARDATGNIVAKLYKDGSFFCSNKLAGEIVMGDGRSHMQKMQQIEKQPNVIVTHYKNKVTDFDLLPEQIANEKKQHLLYPEFYRQYSKEIQEVMTLRERILAL